MSCKKKKYMWRKRGCCYLAMYQVYFLLDISLSYEKEVIFFLDLQFDKNSFIIIFNFYFFFSKFTLSFYFLFFFLLIFEGKKGKKKAKGVCRLIVYKGCY